MTEGGSKWNILPNWIVRYFFKYQDQSQTKITVSGESPHSVVNGSGTVIQSHGSSTLSINSNNVLGFAAVAIVAILVYKHFNNKNDRKRK